jgi:HSP20 family molecular chaperone IbpA
LEVKDRVLHISASRNQTQSEGTTIRSKEFDFGNFQRALKLDDRIDPENIHARYENGVLVITLAKRVKDSWKKEIHID